MAEALPRDLLAEVRAEAGEVLKNIRAGKPVGIKKSKKTYQNKKGQNISASRASYLRRRSKHRNPARYFYNKVGEHKFGNKERKTYTSKKDPSKSFTRTYLSFTVDEVSQLRKLAQNDMPEAEAMFDRAGYFKYPIIKPKKTDPGYKELIIKYERWRKPRKARKSKKAVERAPSPEII